MAGVTILDGNRFYVADEAGDAARGTEGLYADDVRMLSCWQLSVNGRPVEPLAPAAAGGEPAVTVYGRMLAPDVPGAAPVASRRRLTVSRAGLQETLTLTNHATAPAEVVVGYRFAADFADLYEVKEQQLGNTELALAQRLPPPSTSRRWLPDRRGWLLSARAGSFTAAVQVEFAADPAAAAYADGATRYRVALPPGGTWTVRAAVLVLTGGGTEPHPDPAAELAAAARQAADRLADWRDGTPELVTGWPALAAVYRRSVADLGALRTPVPVPAGSVDGAGPLLVPAAGLPWFMTVFGRDTLVTCLQTLALGQRPARAALTALAALQSTVDDPMRDAEPGKILHELRAGKVARLAGTLPYYGSVDATPLFVLLAVETWRWTGDDGLVAGLEPALRAALSWMEGPADLSGRGYLEFHRRSPDGIEMQSWKDSFNSMLFADGRRAASPIAACEVQGYGYAARLGLAEVAEQVWGDRALADRLRADAADLRARFHRDFWVDTPAGGHYALALDRAGAPVDSLTSNIGHLLWTGIAADSTVDRTVAALLSPALFSGWGVRTMSTADAGYHPVEYHDGTVWPHDTSLACLGLARAGRYAEAAVLLRGLVDAAEQLDWRLPEVLAGYDRADTGVPVVYPTTCSPQAWAAAAPVAALTAVLGLTPDRAAGTLTARGAPPPDLDVVLSGVPALGRLWTVTARAGAVSVAPADAAAAPGTPAPGTR
jgi:glycogen debranching enzyme